jgi:hypothetical protein
MFVPPVATPATLFEATPDITCVTPAEDDLCVLSSEASPADSPDLFPVVVPPFGRIYFTKYGEDEEPISYDSDLYLLPAMADLPDFKSLEECREFYEEYFKNKEEQLLMGILKYLGVSRTDFEAEVKEKQKRYKVLAWISKKIIALRRVMGLGNAERRFAEERFGYDPYKIMEDQFNALGRDSEVVGFEGFTVTKKGAQEFANFGYADGLICFPPHYPENEFCVSIAHEIQHIDKNDMALGGVLKKLILAAGGESLIKISNRSLREFLDCKLRELKVLQEFRCDILGCLQNDLWLMSGILLRARELSNPNPVFDASGGSTHPSHKERIYYLGELLQHLRECCGLPSCPLVEFFRGKKNSEINTKRIPEDRDGREKSGKS